jgi:hypothetical protein
LNFREGMMGAGADRDFKGIERILGGVSPDFNPGS